MSNLSKTKTEPALYRGVVVAVLTLLASLGVSWAADPDRETIAALVALAAVTVPLLQAVWTRYAVTPVAKVVARVSTSTGRVVAGEAATIQTGATVPVTVEPSGTLSAVAPVDPALLR